jgi:hypothetical protein
MKKQFLSLAAVCSVFALSAKVNEAYIAEAVFKQMIEANQKAMICQTRLSWLNIVNAPCIVNGATLEEVEKELTAIVEQIKNIPDDETQETMMLKAQAALFLSEFEKIAEVIRKNELPAIDAQSLKKGVDVQATRLKIVAYFESLLK